MNRLASSRFRRLLTSLACFLAVALNSMAANADGRVSLHGRILQPDGTSPYQNAVVRIVNQDTGQIYSSEPTAAMGQYEFTELPSGSYTAEVEVLGGTYELDRSLLLGKKQEASVSFIVKPEQQEIGTTDQDGKKRKGKRGVLAAIIVAGVALVAIESLDDDEASQFTPNP